MTTTSATTDRTEGRKRRQGFFLSRAYARLVLFFRQVMSELKKVVRPTRTELITYTTVVLVFVMIIMTFVSLLDLGLGHLVLWVFGGDSAS